MVYGAVLIDLSLGWPIFGVAYNDLYGPLSRQQVDLCSSCFHRSRQWLALCVWEACGNSATRGYESLPRIKMMSSETYPPPLPIIQTSVVGGICKILASGLR